MASRVVEHIDAPCLVSCGQEVSRDGKRRAGEVLLLLAVLGGHAQHVVIRIGRLVLPESLRGRDERAVHVVLGFEFAKPQYCREKNISRTMA